MRFWGGFFVGWPGNFGRDEFDGLDEVYTTQKKKNTLERVWGTQSSQKTHKMMNNPWICWNRAAWLEAQG